MNWPFLAVVFSGWLYIDAIYRGPVWQRWVFKPVTLVLLLLWVWQAPEAGTHTYLIFLALALSLVGDAIQALTKERLLLVVGAYFACNLLYTISFAIPLNFSFHFPLLLGLLVVGGIVLALIWTNLQEMNWPVLTYYCVTILMVWAAGERYLSLNSSANFSLMIGSVLLWISASLWLINLYRFSMKAADGVVAVFYFLGHFMIVRSLHLINGIDVIIPSA